MSEKTKPDRLCIGYGEHEGKCLNVAGTPWTDYWCKRCDELRREKITASLEALAIELAKGESK